MSFNSRDKEILLEFADASDDLLEIGVISTDSFTGEIGEFYACKAYNLQKSGRVNKGFDGICILGNRYQIKAKISKGNYSYTITKLKPDYFEYLVVIFFDKNYSPQKIIRIPQSKIQSEVFRLTPSNICNFDNFDLSKLEVSKIITEKIIRFGKIYNSLIERKIIRSRKVVGDIGEFYAANRLNLQLEENKNSKGLDARDDKGNTYEIKSRRVYESKRRNSDKRRINGLVGKTAKFLIVVTLDRKFLCSGMWIMPTANIYNPKSANLRMVNTTPGVKNLVLSQISYLQSGIPFSNTDTESQTKKVKRRKNTIKATTEKIEIKERVRKNDSSSQKPKEENTITSSEIIAALVIMLFVIFLVLRYN